MTMPLHGTSHALQMEHSWSYCSTGEKASAGAYAPYSEPFGTGDEIACMLDLTAAEPTLTFAKNGVLLGAVRVIKVGQTAEDVVSLAVAKAGCMEGSFERCDMYPDVGQDGRCLRGLHDSTISVFQFVASADLQVMHFAGCKKVMLEGRGAGGAMPHRLGLQR